MEPHVYERQFAVGDGNALHIPAGTSVLCFDLDFPHSALITKLIVRQNGGSDVGYQVNLFNRQVCDIYPGAGSSSAPSAAVSEELAKVIPTQNVAAGEVCEVFNPDGYTFKNKDAAGTHSVPIKKIYLQIGVDSVAEDTVWEVAIACKNRI